VTGGDRLVAVGRLTGTVSGPYFGVEATGRKFDVPLVSILTFQGKRIVAESNHVDMLALFTQIGILGDEALEATTGRSA
jgi:predicted ester cyclase